SDADPYLSHRVCARAAISMKGYTSSDTRVVFAQCERQQEHQAGANGKHPVSVNVRQRGCLRPHAEVETREGLLLRVRQAHARACQLMRHGADRLLKVGIQRTRLLHQPPLMKLGTPRK